MKLITRIPSAYLLRATVIVVLATLVATAAEHNGESSSENVEKVLKELQSTDLGARGEAWQQIVAERKEFIQGLIEIADTEKPYAFPADPREIAIDLLGRLGAKEAIPVLLKHVDWKAVTQARFPGLDGYPCALALHEFGQISTYKIISHVQTAGPDVSDERITIFAHVCLSGFGSNEGGYREAIGIVDRAMKRASHPENLRRLRDKMKELRVGWQEPD